MTAVSSPTDVFRPDRSQRTLTLALTRRRPLPMPSTSAQGEGILAHLETQARSGWTLSVGNMFGDTGARPVVYETGFSADVDFIAAFEAPSTSVAFTGITALETAGWNALFTTEWLVGPREFLAVPASNRRGNAAAPWALFALWEWNDAWQAASAGERARYDVDCDEAFQLDVDSGISIAGRHRMDHASSWHHLGIWEVPTYEVLDRAMHAHERVADFKFTTSRHYLGRRRDLADALGGT